MLYLWIKALHIVFVVAWFAGLFYLPRLFVYHADTTDAPGHARFQVMERRLLALTTLAGSVAAVLGLTLIALAPAWLAAPWLRLKLALVVGLVVYHIQCARLVSRFRDGRHGHTARWYRFFNEIPTIFLFVIVVLVVVKPG